MLSSHHRGTMRRRTLDHGFRIGGLAVHSGLPCAATVQPAPFGCNLTFVAPDGTRIPAQLNNVVDYRGQTTLGEGPHKVAMVEHLLAALYATGITDADIAVEGGAIPILDGSARPWTEQIRGVALLEGPPLTALVLTKPLRVSTDDAWAEASPCDDFNVGVSVDFDDPTLPKGSFHLSVHAESFESEVAWARTFALERDIPGLHAMGRGLGSTEENTVIYCTTGPKHPERGPNEAVRHKLLDAIGDLALLGAPLRGRIRVHKGSHQLHHALVRAILGQLLT